MAVMIGSDDASAMARSYGFLIAMARSTSSRFVVVVEKVSGDGAWSSKIQQRGKVWWFQCGEF
jgi:hypothetical protein